MHYERCMIIVALVMWQLAGASAKGTDAPTFERDVRPIFKAHCFQCHGEEGVKEGGLDVRLRRGLLQGGDSGPVIVPGDSDASDLLTLVSRGDMPRKAKRLKDSEIETIRRWIESGARTAREEPERANDAQLLITDEERQWWAFQPITWPDVPQNASHPVDAFVIAKLRENSLEPAQEADRRTLVRRAYVDLIGVPPTLDEAQTFIDDRRPDAWERLIDRLLESPRYGERWARHWLDVVGYADSEGYNDDDQPRASAWRYRDYVIRSFNANKPFDQFIHEQLAGDELIGYPKSGELAVDEIEKLTATGYLRMAPDGTGSRNTDQKLAQNAVVTETVKIISSSLLGLTVGCAECHDHRYDPILQQDFYRLRAIIEPGLNVADWQEPRRREVSLMTSEQAEKIAHVDRQIAQLQAEYQTQLDEFQAWTVEKELQAIEPSQREFAKQCALAWQAARKQKSSPSLTVEQEKFLFDYPYLKVAATEQQLNLFIQRHKEKIAEFEAAVKQHKEQLDQLAARKPMVGMVRALFENPAQPIPATRVFARGNYENLGDEVQPGDLSVLAHLLTVNLPDDRAAIKTSGRRLAFAKHLTGGKHPLVARVLVNRFWLHHFGSGIVGTPGNFGRQGNTPTHPQLLDWLANYFMESRWNLKAFHKLIMTSATYKQSSRRRADAEQIDASNQLYWRANVRRLDAEAIRDAILSVSGQLNHQCFGPAAPVAEDENAQIIVGGLTSSLDGNEFRRSIYVEQRRSAPAYQLAVFDAPQMEPNCEVRSASTIAPQSLLLLNSNFLVRQSQAVAAKVRALAGSDADERVLGRTAWELVFGQHPSADDLRDSSEFLHDQLRLIAGRKNSVDNHATLKVGDDVTDSALASLCQALLGANQFLYAD